MKHLKKFENKNDIIFVRTENFDNKGAVNKLPYNGIHCWCIYKNDYKKYINELELWGGYEKNVKIIEPTNEIYALDYYKAHKYVMGESSEIPELEIFNKYKHTMNFIKQDTKSMLEYIADMKYQIIMKI